MTSRPTQSSNPSGLSIHHSWNNCTAIDTPDLDNAAVYRFGDKLPKPCFHPLTTPRGHSITGFEMSDHVWHRGLWFAIKFLNKSNFWEERPPFGVQNSVSHPQSEMLSADTVRISHELEWTSAATGPTIRESRSMVYRGGADGVSTIDFSTSLSALQDLLLDRTPYTTWGGYSGLTFRASREVHQSSYLLPSGETKTLVAGEQHSWMVFRGMVDSGVDQKISLGMIDHPSNPRSPSPWYCKAGNSYDFMCAAFLFHEPMTFEKGKTLDFRYRVLYRDGWWEAAEFASLADAFVNSVT